MQVRPFEPRDIGPVTSLVRNVLAQRDMGADFGGLGIDVREVGVGERAGTWVCEVDGEVAGVLVIQPGEGETCAVKRLCVAPDHQRKGVGSGLVDQGVAWARQVGYRCIEARVPGAFPDLHAFLSRCRFERLADRCWKMTL